MKKMNKPMFSFSRNNNQELKILPNGTNNHQTKYSPTIVGLRGDSGGSFTLGED